MNIRNPQTTPERLALVAVLATETLTQYAISEKPEDLELAGRLEQINQQVAEISKKELGA